MVSLEICCWTCIHYHPTFFNVFGNFIHEYNALWWNMSFFGPLWIPPLSLLTSCVLTKGVLPVCAWVRVPAWSMHALQGPHTWRKLTFFHSSCRAVRACAFTANTLSFLNSIAGRHVSAMSLLCENLLNRCALQYLLCCSGIISQWLGWLLVFNSPEPSTYSFCDHEGGKPQRRSQGSVRPAVTEHPWCSLTVLPLDCL